MITIHVSTRFKRSFQKQPDPIKQDFARKIKEFIKHPFQPPLHTHKLRGNLQDCYSFYLKDGFRVLFEFIESETILLVNIGGHDDYKKWTSS